MGENPSYFDKSADSEVLSFNGKNIELQPDHPVESVTWWSALVFTNRLSEKHGLPPAYDLSGITWDPDTRPEDGTLLPVKDRAVNKIRVYVKGKSYDPYKGETYYQVEGYRLPTKVEQEYMLRGGGKTKGDSFFKNESDMAKHAWYRGNSDVRTHPVGLLRAIMVDGEGFYDLYGNVMEWGWSRRRHYSVGRLRAVVADGKSFYNHYGSMKGWGWGRHGLNRSQSAGGLMSGLQGEINPTGLKEGISHWVSGGAYNNPSEFPLTWRFASDVLPTLGFRLVRTIEQGDGE